VPDSGRGVALVRLPGERLAEGIVTHLERAAVDVSLARRQHQAYVAALTSAGWRVVAVPEAPDHPDAVFVEDTVVVVDDLAVLTHPGAPERRGEVEGTRAAVTALGLRVVELALARPGAGPTLDGGDVLQVGRRVYVGRGGRTNADGVRALRDLLAPLGRTVVPVPLDGVLHLKSALTALPDGTLIGLPDRLDAAGLPGLRVAPEEPGAHVVPLGEGSLLMAASAPRTAAWLDQLGFDVVTVDIGEFEKLEGCVTCLSVLVPAPAPAVVLTPPR
jgi:dimethylargininase